MTAAAGIAIYFEALAYEEFAQGYDGVRSALENLTEALKALAGAAVLPDEEATRVVGALDAAYAALERFTEEQEERNGQ